MLRLDARQTAAAKDALCADRIAGYFPLTVHDEKVWATLLHCFHNKKTGECWPSYTTIAKTAGISRRCVANSIKRLKAAGWLRWQRRRRRVSRWQWTQDSNLYELRIPRRWARSVAECKACARTTALFTKIGVAHLMRPPRPTMPTAEPTPQPEQPSPPSGYGSNSLAAIEDQGLREALARLGAAVMAREAVRLS